jgi:hypothetical protein
MQSKTLRSTLNSVFFLAVTMALTLVLYWPGLGGPFLLDDEASLRHIAAWLDGSSTWQHMLFGGSAGTFGRPIALASLAFDAWISGFNTFAFKRGNLCVHLVCGVLVYLLMSRLSQRDARLAPHARVIALGVSAVWLLHPFNASTVLYVVQRMAQVSALFVLLGLWLYLGLRSRLEARQSTSAVAALFIAIPTLTVLGFLGKETALLLPTLCLTLELTCYAHASRPRAVKWFFALFCVLPTLGGLTYLIARPAFSFSVYAARDFGLWERLLSQTRALCDYLWKIVAPNPPQMGVYFDDFPVSTSLINPPSTLISIMVLIAISTAAWRLRKSIPSLLTGWALFLAGHAMESTILPLELYFEHRNYLPMIGILYAVAGLLVAAGDRLRSKGIRSTRIGVVAAAGVLMVLSLGTHGRARVWSTPESIALGATAARPESFRANILLIQEALRANDRTTVDAALQRLSTAKSARTRAYAQLNRIVIACIIDGKGNSEDLREAAIAFPPRTTQSDWDLFGTVYRNVHNCEGIDDLALANTLDAIVDKATIQPDSLRFKFQLRHVVARIYARAGNWPAALEQASLSWQPGTEAAAAEILVRAQIETGDIAGAERTFAEAKQRASAINTYDTAGLTWLRQQIDAARAQDQASSSSEPASVK